MTATVLTAQKTHYRCHNLLTAEALLINEAVVRIGCSKTVTEATAYNTSISTVLILLCHTFSMRNYARTLCYTHAVYTGVLVTHATANDR
jgi:hypothetical protein